MLDWTIEEYLGANCTGIDGATNRTLTLQNTDLTNDNGFLVSVSVPGGNYLILEKDVEYTIVHNQNGSVITFLNALWDDMAIRARYYVKTEFTWKIEHLMGSDGTGSDGDSNRIITLNNTQLTTTGGFQVTASGLTLMREVEYTAEHKATGTEVTFLNPLWDSMTIVIKYYQKPDTDTKEYSGIRDDIQEIILEHGINATLIRQNLATDQVGVEITDTMGGMSELAEEGYNRKYYNIFVMIQSTSLKKRDFKEIGKAIPGEAKAFFFHEYPDSVTGNGSLIVEIGDELIDQDFKHWKIESINSERHMQGFDIFKVGILKKIDND